MNRFITWGMSHVMNLFMGEAGLTIPQAYEQIHHVGIAHVMNLFISSGGIVRPASAMNRFITWDIPHVMNLFMEKRSRAFLLFL